MDEEPTGSPYAREADSQFVNVPNRYCIPVLFELHVWTWRENPNGAFVDWTTGLVSNDGAVEGLGRQLFG